MKTGDTIHIPRFFCHAPLPRLTDKDDYAHHGSEAILKYVQEKQPKYVFTDTFTRISDPCLETPPSSASMAQKPYL